MSISDTEMYGLFLAGAVSGMTHATNCDLEKLGFEEGRLCIALDASLIADELMKQYVSNRNYVLNSKGDK